MKVIEGSRKKGSLPQVKGYRNNKGNLTWVNKSDAWIDGADKSKERGKIDAMFTGIATNMPQEGGTSA